MSVNIKLALPTKNLTLAVTKLLTNATDDEVNITPDDLGDEAIEFEIGVETETVKLYVDALPEILRSITTLIGDLENVGSEAATRTAAASGNFEDILRGAHERNAARRRRDGAEPTGTDLGGGIRTSDTSQDDEEQDG